MTRVPSSSTALIEAGAARRGHPIGSAATAAGTPGVYAVPLSVETPIMRPFLVPLGFPPSIRSLIVANEPGTHQPQSVFTLHPFPAITTGNVLILRSAVMPISGLRPMLSSTDSQLGASRLVRGQFAEAAALAGAEWFEDGVESRFSRGLSSLLHAYSDGVIATVEEFVGSPNTNVEVAVEAARWLGEVDHAATKLYRRTLLEKMLNATAVRLRHGAAAGLASMDDPSSLDTIRGALGREANSRLRDYLQLVVNQLERTQACRN